MINAARSANGAPIPTSRAFAFMYMDAKRNTLQYRVGTIMVIKVRSILACNNPDLQHKTKNIKASKHVCEIRM